MDLLVGGINAGNLDTHTGEQILNLFHDLHHQSRTIAAIAQRKIEIRDGKIV
jgi:ABC-type lipoprotein export system ATPase subunit